MRKTSISQAAAQTTNNDAANAQFEEQRAQFYAGMFGYKEGSFPSGKRMLISFIVNVAICAVGSYAAGCIAGALGVAAMLLSGSTFLAYCVYFIVIIAGIVASMLAGSKVAQYIAFGKVDQDYARAKSWISSKFGRKSPGGELEEDYVTVKTTVKDKVAAARSAFAAKTARRAA